MIREWIITVAVSGNKGYDIFRASEELNGIWWTASNATKNINVNDIIYMYVGKPYSKIMYKFICTGVDISSQLNLSRKDLKYWNNPELHSDANCNCFKIEKLQFINDDNLSLEKLNELGLIKGHIQGSYKSDNNKKLFEYIDNKFNIYFDSNDDKEYDNIINSNGEILEIEDTLKGSLIAKRVNEYRKFKRDPRIGRYAIMKSSYKCEVNDRHLTFISRGNDKPYMEAHHLIPISSQASFENSLDVPANIISLCSTCHNEIHYGKDLENLIRFLYNMRKERLLEVGIDITIEKLLDLYNL